MYQYWFVDYNKQTTGMHDNSRENWWDCGVGAVCEKVYRNSVIFA